MLVLPLTPRITAGPWAGLLLLLTSLLIAPIGPADTGPLDEKDLRSLRSKVEDLGELGLEREMGELRQLLLDLGDDPARHEKEQERWDRALERAESRGKQRVLERAAKGLSKEVRVLEGHLEGLEPEDANDLARLILRLDGSSEVAHRALGHVDHAGVWRSPRQVAWYEGEQGMAALVQRARSLEVEVSHGPSTVPILHQLYGDEARKVSVPGLELHGALAPERLERMLRESVRAMAFAQAAMGSDLGAAELRLPGTASMHRIVLVRDEAGYETALQEAEATGGIKSDDLRRQRASRMTSFIDTRGWRLSRNWTEAYVQAVTLFTCSDKWLGFGAQPCFVAGQLNWVCLNFFGTAMPSISWLEKRPEDGRTTSKRAAREDLLWKSAARSLHGSRSWLRARLEAGERFPYDRAVLPELGQVAGEKLLKATMVQEYLQVVGRVGEVVESSRDKEDRLAAVEAALGMDIPAFEAEWEAWFLGGSGSQAGILQRLGAGSGEEGFAEDAEQFLAALLVAREAALDTAAPWAETPSLFRDLCEGSIAHARYLTLNPEQGAAWPDAHEEYADREGWSVEGAWAGLHGVIHFTPDPVEALDGWLGTFYHRLPLLEPGLFGIGWGVDGRVSVADTTSLLAPNHPASWVVWPAHNASEVPLRFQPELPNPVPGEDQSTWGYPITLQANWGSQKADRTILLELHEGKQPGETPVACHFLTPSEPAFPELAPEDAYCLIPKRHLKAKTTYTVVATCPETGDRSQTEFHTGS